MNEQNKKAAPEEIPKHEKLQLSDGEVEKNCRRCESRLNVRSQSSTEVKRRK